MTQQSTNLHESLAQDSGSNGSDELEHHHRVLYDWTAPYKQKRFPSLVLRRPNLGVVVDHRIMKGRQRETADGLEEEEEDAEEDGSRRGHQVPQPPA